MATFTITINNESNVPRQFFLFQDMPRPTNLQRKQVFTNVYQLSPVVSSGQRSSTTFFMQQKYYAIYGTSVQDPNGLFCVSTSDTTAVNLGPRGTVAALTTVDGDGTYPEFDRIAAPREAIASRGGFSIRTDNTFKYPSPDNIYVGCGASDPHSGATIPIQTCLAQPGLNIQLFPKAKYCVAFASYEPGTIIDRATIENVLQVDFTDATTSNAATFTLRSNGVYDADPSSHVNWTFGPLWDA